MNNKHIIGCQAHIIHIDNKYVGVREYMGLICYGYHTERPQMKCKYTYVEERVGKSIEYVNWVCTLTWNCLLPDPLYV